MQGLEKRAVKRAAIERSGAANTAAVDWLSSKKMDVASEYDAEGCREDYLFPLPLPLIYDSSFKYVSGKNQHYNAYIEILVSRTDRL